MIETNHYKVNVVVLEMIENVFVILNFKSRQAFFYSSVLLKRV